MILNCPRRADVAWFSHHRVVLALAVNLADGVDRRKIHCVEAHVCDSLQRFGRGLESAVDGVAFFIPTARRTREELIPRVIKRFSALDQYLVDLAFHEQIPQGVRMQFLYHGVGKRCLDARGQVQRLIR